jgi:hypothetical protein
MFWRGKSVCEIISISIKCTKVRTLLQSISRTEYDYTNSFYTTSREAQTITCRREYSEYLYLYCTCILVIGITVPKFTQRYHGANTSTSTGTSSVLLVCYFLFLFMYIYSSFISSGIFCIPYPLFHLLVQVLAQDCQCNDQMPKCIYSTYIPIQIYYIQQPSTSCIAYDLLVGVDVYYYSGTSTRTRSTTGTRNHISSKKKFFFFFDKKSKYNNKKH